MSEKILYVDDEQNVLDAHRRGLRKQFNIDTALGGEQALAALQSQGPYAVIISDMQMPGMDGVKLLAAVRERAPDTVRMMLTGMTDLATAIGAVNEGNIFRFLTKPCPPDALSRALSAGVEQYRLVTAERELLDKTLCGSIKVLGDVLSLTNPTAFGHASRAQGLVQKLCEELKCERAWEGAIAATLSQIGCVTLPPDTLDKAYHGQKLTADETQMLAAHPSVGQELVANIPRLEGVAQIIAYQAKHYDGSGVPEDSVAGKDIPLGARILKVALDYNTLKWSGLDDIDAMVKLRERSGWYDPKVTKALEAAIGFEEAFEVREVGLNDLTVNMTLAEDVRTEDGMIVVGRGQEVTSPMCQRLKNFSRRRVIVEPIRVLVLAAKNLPAFAQP